MSQFNYKSLCVLGRQPALGLAELESLYGAEHLKPAGSIALLDINAEDINFKNLGGTIKVARILAEIPSQKWTDLAKYLMDNVPQHLQYLPDGKFTLGLSAYDLSVTSAEINKTNLELKKQIKQTCRPVRVVPNKTVALNSAQVLHNKLTHKGSWELVLAAYENSTLLAQTLFVQDIEAYAARDQARPARDARVGMLPPKLAQIILNLAIGQKAGEVDDKSRIRVLDPFCGTGVILQEALLAGYSVYGTDIDSRMVEYTKRNLSWLVDKFPSLEANVTVEAGDAIDYQWPGFTAVASEIYLGRPLNELPAQAKLRQIINDVNTIAKKFLINLSIQMRQGQSICIAVPCWRKTSGQLIKLPLIDDLTDMGYNSWDLKHVGQNDLVYFRENQVVARQLLRLKKV